MSPPYPVIRARVDRALSERDLDALREIARQFPGVITLVDALSVLLLMLEGADGAFDAAAVRWLQRFTRECRGVTLAETHAAVEALGALPASDASATLAALLRRHGLG
jgi:hypothetical protein